MGLSRSNTLFLIGLLVLIALSLHPVHNVESVVEVLFRPAQWLSEIARPLAWLDARSARAADDARRIEDEDDRARARALLLALQAAAMPLDPNLEHGRAFVGAHVIAHLAQREDELVVRFPTDAGIQVGMAVVSGDVYVGRIAELDARQPGEGLVRLVTGRNFRVAAQVEAGSERGELVVGGLLHESPGTESVLDLVAHFPSRRELKSGTVRVHEAGDGGSSALADGFLLGELSTRTVRGATMLVVKAAIDYGHGLNYVAIVCPPQMATAGPVLALDPFDADSWIEARVSIDGSATSWRATRKIALGRDAGPHLGAAVAIGARLVGRVVDVGPSSSDVSLLHDRGMSIGVLARIEGVEAPFALGRLVSRGRENGGGAILFAWDAIVPLSKTSEIAAKAELFTAAGDRDVPPGLVVGTTEIPRGLGPFVLRVMPAQDATPFRFVRVWRGRDAGAKTGAGS